jgi:hypothetical protein
MVLRCAVGAVVLGSLLPLGGASAGRANDPSVTGFSELVYSAFYQYSDHAVPSCAGCQGPSADYTDTSQTYNVSLVATATYDGASSGTDYSAGTGASPAYQPTYDNYPQYSGYIEQTQAAGEPQQDSTNYDCTSQATAADTGDSSAYYQQGPSQATQVTNLWGATYEVPEVFKDEHPQQHCSQVAQGYDRVVNDGSIISPCYDQNGDHCASALAGATPTPAQEKAFDGYVTVDLRAPPSVQAVKDFTTTLDATKVIPAAVPGGQPGADQTSVKVQAKVYAADWTSSLSRENKKRLARKMLRQSVEEQEAALKAAGRRQEDEDAVFIPALPDGGSLGLAITSSAGILMSGQLSMRADKPGALELKLTPTGQKLLADPHAAVSGRATLTFTPTGDSPIKLTSALTFPASA